MKKSNQLKFNKTPLGLAIAGCILSFSIQAACVEDGGTQNCTVPEVGSWKYQVCDEMAPYISIAVRWCTVMGGTWVGTSNGGCIGAEEVTEDNYDSFARSFGQIWVGPNTATVSDWGITSDSYFCYSGPSEYIRPDIPIKEHKKYHFQGSESDGTVWALRTREIKCPVGSKLVKESANKAYCAIEIDQECPVGNPVKPGSGEKVHSQQDYKHQHGFNLVRHYRGQGNLVSVASANLPHKMLGSKWWYEFEKRVVVTPNSDKTLAVKTMPSGELMYFDESGKVVSGFYSNRKDKLYLNEDNTVTVVTKKGIETYSQDGKLQAEVDLNGRRLTYIYSDGSSINGIDVNGELATVTVPEGMLIRVETDEQTQLLFGYDGQQRLTAIRLPGELKILHEFEDANNNLVKTTYPDGSSEIYHYENTTYPTILTGITDATGTRYVTYEYDSAARVIQSSVVGGVQGYQYDYGWNSWGASRTTVWNPIDTPSVYQMGHFGDYVSTINVWQAPGAGSSGQNKYFYYNTDGQMTSWQDFDRTYTDYTYDPDRKLELTSTKEGKKASKQWHLFWPLETGIAQPNLIQYWVYNGQQNPLTGETTWCAPSTATIIDDVPIAVVCNYIEQPTTDATGSAGFNGAADGLAKIWSYSYDARGNMLTNDGPRTDVNDITTYAYWPINAECPDANVSVGMDKGCRGQLKTATNALGHITHYLKYDAQGNLLQQRDPDGIETLYSYDANQRVISYTKAGITNEYSYDSRGLLTHISFNSEHEVDYQYDAAHRLIGLQDNQGNSINYTLDAAGNITNKQVIDPQGNLRQNIDRQYDALSRLQREQKGI